MSEVTGSNRQSSHEAFAEQVRAEYEARLTSEITRISAAVDNSAGYTDYGLRSGVKNFRKGCRRQWESLWDRMRHLPKRDCLRVLLCLLQDLSEILGSYSLYLRAKYETRGPEDPFQRR